MNKSIILTGGEIKALSGILQNYKEELSCQCLSATKLGKASDQDNRTVIKCLGEEIAVIVKILKKLEDTADNIPPIYKAYTDNTDLLNALKDFDADRRERNLKTTDRSRKMILTKLDGLTQSDNEKIKILAQSIEKGWNGVFPLSGGGKAQGKPEKEHSYDLDDFYQRALNSTPSFK